MTALAPLIAPFGQCSTVNARLVNRAPLAIWLHQAWEGRLELKRHTRLATHLDVLVEHLKNVEIG